MRPDYYGFDTSEDELRIAPRRRKGHIGAAAGGAATLVFLGMVATQMMAHEPAPAERRAEAPAPLAPRFAPRPYAELLDPSYTLGARPTTFRTDEPVSASVSLAPAASIAAARMTELREKLAEARTPDEAPAQVAAAKPEPLDTVAPMPAPMPAPRPAEFAMAEPEDVGEDFTPGPTPPRRPADLAPQTRPEPKAMAEAKPAAVAAAPAETRVARGRRARTTVAVASQPQQEPSFFEKLFGGAQTSGTRLAYAGQESGLLGDSGRLAGRPASGYASDGMTAVYDISAHTVYMPDGSRLEAHSGLGSLMDNPSYVNVRMRGATPPHLYDLTEREKLFHGVRAIRLTPIGGAGAIHGRNGLLAHTYMLGPNGQSNGCVSFRDYNRFLQAFLDGKVRRLKVVSRM